MKKKNVVLYAGILSMVMLGGCGASTSTDNSTPATQEATEAPVADEATLENEEKNNSTEVTNEENASEETEIQEEKHEEKHDRHAACALPAADGLQRRAGD